MRAMLEFVCLFEDNFYHPRRVSTITNCNNNVIDVCKFVFPFFLSVDLLKLKVSVKWEVRTGKNDTLGPPA
jgi:hypothetical protein